MQVGGGAVKLRHWHAVIISLLVSFEKVSYVEGMKGDKTRQKTCFFTALFTTTMIRLHFQWHGTKCIRKFGYPGHIGSLRSLQQPAGIMLLN